MKVSAYTVYTQSANGGVSVISHLRYEWFADEGAGVVSGLSVRYIAKYRVSIAVTEKRRYILRRRLQAWLNGQVLTWNLSPSVERSPLDRQFEIHSSLQSRFSQGEGSVRIELLSVECD